MKLIMNGDDFGITHACNLAIIDCYKTGVMRSTSMMTNMTAAEEAAELMNGVPDLSVGLHLNLTVGSPIISDLDTITRDGQFSKDIFSNQKNIDLAQVRMEFNAQYNRFIELTGVKPSHINTHHCLEKIQGVKDIILDLAQREQLPVRGFINSEERYVKGYDYMIPQVAWIIKEDWSVPTSVSQIKELFSTEMLSSEAVVEYCAHPGYVDRELIQISSLTDGRAYDAYNFMCDEIKKWIIDNYIELVDYSAIPRKANAQLLH